MALTRVQNKFINYRKIKVGEVYPYPRNGITFTDDNGKVIGFEKLGKNEYLSDYFKILGIDESKNIYKIQFFLNGGKVYNATINSFTERDHAIANFLFATLYIPFSVYNFFKNLIKKQQQKP